METYHEKDLMYMKWLPRQRGPMRNKYQVRDQFKLVVYHATPPKPVKPAAIPEPIIQIDWLKPGASCYAKIDIGSPERKPQWAQCKAHILGTSKSGKVWILASFYQRGPKRKMIDEWELRLVWSHQLDPLSSGVVHPPAMPSSWRNQLSVMSFDTARLALV